MAHFIVLVEVPIYVEAESATVAVSAVKDNPPHRDVVGMQYKLVTGPIKKMTIDVKKKKPSWVQGE